MIDATLLDKLSLLARVRVAPEDVEQRLIDFQSILKCIDELQSVTIPADFVPVPSIINHARLDEVHSASEDTVTRIRESFPESQLGQLKVPVVLSK